MTVHNALLLELRHAEQKRRQRPTIAHWWQRKLHGQWTYPEGIRAAAVVSAVMWAGIGWLVLA